MYSSFFHFFSSSLCHSAAMTVCSLGSESGDGGSSRRMRLPVKIFGFDVAGLLGHVLFVVLQHFGSERDDMLTLVVLDEMQSLQRRDNVLSFDRSHFGQIANRKRTTLVLENLHQLRSPVRPKRQVPQI
jgi:hypothetical protein